MSGSIFGIAVTGLNSAKAALEVTSHNIGNVNTQGYTRQTTTQKASDPLFEGYGFVGTGVNLTGVNRVYDQFTEKQMRDVNAKVASLDAQKQSLQDLDNLMADSTAGLSSVLQGFFSSIQTMNSQPSSTAARQSVLSQAQALAGRFAAIGGRVEELRQGLATQVNSSVESINAYAGEIASINRQIATLQQGNGRLPNDLLDRRDNLVQKLNELVKTDVVVQDDGSYSVFIGQGQSLVLGDQAGKMVMERVNPDDPDAISVGISIPNVTGTITIDPARMGGGKLEGIMQVLGTDVRRIQTDLGRMAVELSDAFNRQHSLGYDLNGQPATGALFFNDLTAERAAAEATGASPDKQAFYMRQALDKFGVALTEPSKIAASSGLQATHTVDPVAGKPSIASVWQTANLHQSTTAALDTNKTLGQVLGQATPAVTSLNIQYDPSQPMPYSVTPVPAGLTISAVSLSSTQSGVYEFTVQSGNDKVNISFKPEGSASTIQNLTLGQRTPGTLAAQNNANMLEMGKLQTKPLLRPTPTASSNLVPPLSDTPTTNLQAFYGQMVSYVGNRANVADVALTAQEASKQQVMLSREEISGVNLDEEAANLIRFQQAYQASSRVIQVAQDMFKNLLELR
ncbi:flagellar hook-associated protein FlgK [Vogesella urethralis]|uniref:flagellar hook-associated protein FlgK n=1 Tax=Vogesella urethralis TaxID=2592656 RepID=UPI0011865A0A|nr:flagellar hook-associated protein FlgK [Vogesella urethralis]